MRLSTLTSALKSRWPWVSKKRLTASIAKQRRNLTREREIHASAIRKEREQLRELIGRFAKIRLGCRRDVPDRQYRVTCEVEISPFMVHDVLIHGNDRPVIDYIGNEIAYLITQELHTVNFARLPEVNEQFDRLEPAHLRRVVI